MKLVFNLALAMGVLLSVVNATENPFEPEYMDFKNETCLLTQTKTSKPKPSLRQCFRQNHNSCCITANDYVIEEAWGSIMPESCKDNFPELELFFCLGCHYTQPFVTLYYKNYVEWDSADAEANGGSMPISVYNNSIPDDGAH